MLVGLDPTESTGRLRGFGTVLLKGDRGNACPDRWGKLADLLRCQRGITHLSGDPSHYPSSAGTAHQFAQLFHCPNLNLPDAFTGDSHPLSDGFQCHFLSTMKSEAADQRFHFGGTEVTQTLL